MRNARFWIVFAVLMVLGVPVLWAQDILKVAPKNCRVLLDNAQVRVIRVTLKPGEKIDMHSHGANIVYALTGGKTKFTTSDGKTEEREVKAGQAMWSEAVTHSNENTGTTESRVLLIELKK